MSIRTNIADSLDQVEANQLAQLRLNQETAERIEQLQQIVDLMEQAINSLTDIAEKNTADILTLYTNVDLAMQDIDALTAD